MRADRRKPVQVDVQFQYIDAAFSEKSKLPLFGVGCNHSAQDIFRQVAGRRHSENLKLGCCGRDMRVQARCRRGDQIDRNVCSR